MKQLFDEIIGAPPPTRVDVPAMLRRERRARTARWAGSGLAAVAAAGVVATAASGGAGPPSAPPLADGSSGVVVDTRFALRAETKAAADASGEQLAATVTAATERAAPGSTWHKPGLAVLTTEYSGPADVSWSGHGALVQGSRKGDVDVMALRKPAKPGPKKPEVVDCAGIPRCEAGTSPGGRKIVTIRWAEGGAASIEVRIGLPASGVLILSATNDGAGDPVLSATQVTVIAEDIAGRVKE